MADNFNYKYYGTLSTSKEVIHFIEHLIGVSQKAASEGKKRIPVCIWGKHGIGKTELVEDFAKHNGFAFRYIAPAQFEEMGDLLGMPKVVNGATTFVAPEWVPTEKGPGILLIDDVNRADDRILRGIMQLLQNYELVSWKLPEDWHIILTANPDGGDYAVTPMDDSMITRMMHISLKFDVKTWAQWATSNKIDERGIAFVQLYPEIVSGNRTTPRTLVHFFETIKDIDDLKNNIPLVQMLADATLDMESSTAFISYVLNNLQDIIWPREIINANDFDVEIEKPLKKTMIDNNGTLRVDILSTICSRLIQYVNQKEIVLKKENITNIEQFLLLDFLPNDLRLGMLQDLVQAKNEGLKQVLANPKISKLLLSLM